VKAYAANVAELQIELQTLLHPDSAPSLPEVMSVKSFDEAEQTAERLRKHWELDEHPIDSLVQTAEDHQVVVVAWRQHADEFDGLSGWCNERYPVTVISTIGETDRRRFTLAHELGHLIMDTESVSDKDAEKLAHRFAAALIVPANRASHELGTRRTRLDFEELSILKRKYGLSIAAWIYRAKDLGIISENHAGNLYRELSQRGWRKKEPVDYIGDEVPLKLDQMAHHAVAEGLISPDQIRRIYPNWVEKEVSQPSSGRITVYELLNLSEGERQAVLEEAYRLAANEEFETFEANEFLEENTGVE
jgi:Zn-dependent peptidase ImmA (M78 family)